jgi:hypothetical protein
MSLLGFCEWLANTPWSIAIHESRWAYSFIESVHVLTLCLFLGMAVMLDLRLLGVTMRRTAASEVLGQLLPWTAVGFVLMVISGMLLFYAIPVRTFQNIFFRVKILFLLSAGLNVWIFHSTVYRKVAEWNLNPIPPRRARVAAGLSLALWAGIVVAGRMIAYNWFDCDKPQRAIIILAAGCRTESR